MNFVNKLSVVSLLVLMFSFINISQAAECSGTAVSYCNQSTTQSACEKTYRSSSPKKLCAWSSSTCSASGASCGCSKNSDCTYSYGTCDTSTGKCSYSSDGGGN